MLSDSSIPILSYVSHLKNMQCLDLKSPIEGYVYRWGKPFRHGDPYPEITGYFMTSFSRMFDMTGEADYLDRAKRSAYKIINSQKTNGSIPTVVDSRGNENNICHFFDLAIIARGLLDVYNRTADEKILTSAKNAMKFMAQLVNEKDLPSVVNLQGLVLKNKGFPEPFWINTKAIIPLYMLNQIEPNPMLLKLAETINQKLAIHQQEDGGFRLKNDSPYNRTHYHAYAAYGVSHLYQWTKEKEIFERVLKATNWLISCLDQNGGVFTYTNPQGKPIIENGYDVPVSAQLGELCIFIEKNCPKDLDLKIYIETRKKCDSFLTNMTQKKPMFKYLDGGLPFMIKRGPSFLTVPWGELFSINYYYDKNWIKK
jgi:uncharacterized protein YyaL (SSP411 family)